MPFAQISAARVMSRAISGWFFRSFLPVSVLKKVEICFSSSVEKFFA